MQPKKNRLAWLAILAVAALITLMAVWPDSTAVAVHPVLQTPVTGESSWRPAVQVEVLNPSESWFGNAELYLAAQSSRFPSDCHVLIPLTEGNADGIRNRFVQLPFEVDPGDTVIFNLLDADSLSSDEEGQLIDACRAAGFCLWCAGTIYNPNVGRFIAPSAADTASELLGKVIVSGIAQDDFDNYGYVEYRVPASIPSSPSQANELTVLEKDHARVQLRLYAPETALETGAN